MSKYEKLSLASLVITLVAVITHHIFRFGFITPVIIPAILGILLPFVLILWFRQRKNKIILWIYAGFTTVVFLLFSVEDGFLDHVLKAFRLPHTGYLPGSQAQIVATTYHLWSVQATSNFYEITGILQTIVGIFAMYYCYRFLREEFKNQTKKIL
jgi:hypothetical protein